MSDDLVTLATYESPFEAHEARSRLAEVGIDSQVSDENMVSALPILGNALGGVKLLVWKSQASKAEALLFPEDLEHDKAKKHIAGPDKAWICRRCRERNEPAFDVCWSCGADFDWDRSQEPAEQAVGEGDVPNVAEEDDLNEQEEDRPERPYEREELSDPEVEAAIKRAWRAAIFGLAMFPIVLQFYSLWLLMGISGPDRKFTRHDYRWYYTTLAVDILFLGVLAVVIYSFATWMGETQNG